MRMKRKTQYYRLENSSLEENIPVVEKFKFLPRNRAKYVLFVVPFQANYIFFIFMAAILICTSVLTLNLKPYIDDLILHNVIFIYIYQFFLMVFQLKLSD